MLSLTPLGGLTGRGNESLGDLHKGMNGTPSPTCIQARLDQLASWTGRPGLSAHFSDTGRSATYLTQLKPCAETDALKGPQWHVGVAWGLVLGK